MARGREGGDDGRRVWVEGIVRLGQAKMTLEANDEIGDK